MPRPAPRFRVEQLEDRSVPATFITALTFPVGPDGGEDSRPDGITTADFNRDGKLDVATANTGAKGISILLGHGNGRFAPAVNRDLGRAPVGIKADDLNADGKADLITANQADDTVTILLGNGTGGFATVGHLPAGNGPVDVAVADLNGDGKKDIAVANRDSNTVTLLLGNGTGGFTQGGTMQVGNGPTAVAVGDFNGDTKPDVATVSGGFGHLNINLNAGGGTFAPTVKYATGFCANDLAVADFNHDQKADIAVGCVFPSGDGVTVLLGAGDGTFPTFTNYDAGNQTPRSIAVGDFNADGHPDVVTANDSFGNNSVSLLTGKGDGTLNPAGVFHAGEQPLGVAVGDFNRDGLPDVVTSNTGMPPEIPWTGPIGVVATLLSNGDGTLTAAPALDVDGPQGVVASDFTGDGKADLAVVTTGVAFNGVTIFPGLGTGRFGPRITTPTANQLSAIAAGDFNEDQKRDLVVVRNGALLILIGVGDGSFVPPQEIALGSPRWVTVSDFNGDVNEDLAVATGAGVSILLGNGDGTFQAPNGLGGDSSTYLAAADLNKDGKQDLAVVSDPAAKLTILHGLGNGMFGVAESHPTQAGPGQVSVGDFNRDGRPDLAVPTFFGPGLMIFRNVGAGKYTLDREYQNDSLPKGSVVGDFTGDGKLDVLTANNFDDTAFVFPGTGTGKFGAPVRYVVGSRPSWVAAGDFNADGRSDVAVTNSIAGSVTLLETPTKAHHLRVTTNVATVTAGLPVTVTVAAVDLAGRPIRNFAGTVTFSSTDRKAGLPAAYTFTGADQGIKRFTVYLRTAGSQNIVARSAGLQLGTATVQVTPGTATNIKLTAPTKATAGTGFDVTVQARDRFGNIDPTFIGTVQFKTSDPNAGVGLPLAYTFAPTDNGSHTFTGVTLLTAGLRSITAVAGTWRSVAPVRVAAGALSKFLVTGLPTTLTANVARSFTVTAADAYGNRVTSYRGTVQFGNMGGTAVLPAPYTFKALNAGRRLFKVTFQTVGPDQSLTVFDQVDPGISGSVTGITVV